MSCTCEHADHVPLDDFLPYVMPQVAGVPAEIAAHNVRLAAIQFANDTQVVKREVYKFLQAGVPYYEIEPPACETTTSVHSVCVNGCEYTPVRTIKGLRCGKVYFYDKRGGLHIGAAPCDLVDGVEVVLNVKPGQDTCWVDRCLYDDYAEAIAAGALSRLYSMGSAPWVNLQMARYQRGLFQEGVGNAKTLNAKGHSSAPMYMKPRRFV